MNDEDDFFVGGNAQGDLIDFEPESYAYISDKPADNMLYIEPEPLVGSTLNLFKLSG